MIAAEPTPPWGQLLALPKTRCFIDTNILVYADSTDEPHKQRIAIDVLRHLRFQRLGVLSTQVLNEYIQVGLRKLGLPHSHVRAQLQCYRQMDLAGVTPDTIDMALQLHGGRGVEVGSKVESLYRDIRSLRIYEGATEVQQLIIGKAMLQS